MGRHCSLLNFIKMKPEVMAIMIYLKLESLYHLCVKSVDKLCFGWL